MKATKLWCQKPGDRYEHFFSNPRGCLMCDSKSEPIRVEVTEDVERPDSYWAWWSNERNTFSMVWQKHMMLEMCFPYGSAFEVARGSGVVVPVKVTEIPKED